MNTDLDKNLRENLKASVEAWTEDRKMLRAQYSEFFQKDSVLTAKIDKAYELLSLHSPTSSSVPTNGKLLDVRPTKAKPEIGVPTNPRWGGVKISEAYRQLKTEHPEWSNIDICNRLVREGFDFKGKNPQPSVNMAEARLSREATAKRREKVNFS